MLNGTGSVPDAITSEIVKTSNSYNYSTKEESFTDAGFNDIYKSASLFRATDFIYQIIKNNWYDVDNGFNSAYSHETAQADFFFGSENGDMDYAFLVDGTWWYNEAERYISLYEKHVADRNTRNVKYFPIPKADEATFERTKGENVVSSSYITGIAVKNDITSTKKLLAETFKVQKPNETKNTA